MLQGKEEVSQWRVRLSQFPQDGAGGDLYPFHPFGFLGEDTCTSRILGYPCLCGRGVYVTVILARRHPLFVAPLAALAVIIPIALLEKGKNDQIT